MKKGESNRKLLTEVELELMAILWQLGEGTAGEVRDVLSARRTLAYTSVSTILRILEQKGAVASRKEGRGHVYRPLLKKERYEGIALSHLVERVFGGTPTALVRRLIDEKKITEAELTELKALIEKRLT